MICMFMSLEEKKERGEKKRDHSAVLCPTVPHPVGI